MKTRTLFVSTLLLASCGRAADTSNAVAIAPEAPIAPQPAAKPEPVERKVLSEPTGPIDPKSVEAAGQVVQHYGALIEQHRWTESRQYWGDAVSAQAFEKSFLTWKDVHVEIGDLGDTEGAAGSIFTDVPVTFYGDLNKGGTIRRAADMILRRVNDVPGSTAAQRRWHIERIEWRDAP